MWTERRWAISVYSLAFLLKYYLASVRDEPSLRVFLHSVQSFLFCWTTCLLNLATILLASASLLWGTVRIGLPEYPPLLLELNSSHRDFGNHHPRSSSLSLTLQSRQYSFCAAFSSSFLSWLAATICSSRSLGWTLRSCLWTFRFECHGEVSDARGSSRRLVCSLPRTYFVILRMAFYFGLDVQY